jgi:hypothetical protein
VKVYTGRDPVSTKPNVLAETVEPGPNAVKEAEKVRTRLLAQLDEKRAPRTSGLRTDARARVPRPDRTVIEGLCALGSAATQHARWLIGAPSRL